MGITGFTVPTLYRWIRCDLGRGTPCTRSERGTTWAAAPGEMVIHEAGLDGEGQYRGLRAYLDALRIAPSARPA